MAKLRQPTMSLPAVLSAWSRRTAIAILAIVLMIFSFVAPAEAVTPTSGPTSGGTSVTIEGIHFVQVVAGDEHAVGLTSEGTVFAWGRNFEGELGDGTTINSFTPVQVKGVGGSGVLTGVTSVSAGGYHSMAVTPTGLYAWGDNAGGQLGIGTTIDSLTPVQVKGVGGSGFLTGVTSVSAGMYHSMAVTSSGVFTWGYNAYGQLGEGTTTSSSTPVQVKGVGGSGFLTGVTSVSSGAQFSLALTPIGVFAWGYNAVGQLGNGSTVSSSTPVQVKGVGGSGFLTGVTSLEGGGYHTLAITSSGLFAWGYNNEGQLGDGTTTNSSSPVQVKGVGGSGFLSGVTKVSCGTYHSLAVTPSGVFAWGLNHVGQLGDGTTTNFSTPVQVKGVGGSGVLAGVMGVSSFSDTTLVTSADGILAWGLNGLGVLGDGTNQMRTAPVLGANFIPLSVEFGSSPASSISLVGADMLAVSPSLPAGTVNITGSASVFGGTTAANPATVSWDAGTFTYLSPAPSSSPSSSSSGSASPSVFSSPSSDSSTAAQNTGGPLAATGVGPVGLWGMVAVLSMVMGALGIVVWKKARR